MRVLDSIISRQPAQADSEIQNRSTANAFDSTTAEQLERHATIDVQAENLAAASQNSHFNYQRTESIG